MHKKTPNTTALGKCRLTFTGRIGNGTKFGSPQLRQVMGRPACSSGKVSCLRQFGQALKNDIRSASKG
jgi:hypothetical protein